jgi:hypothetical protein
LIKPHPRSGKIERKILKNDPQKCVRNSRNSSPTIQNLQKATQTLGHNHSFKIEIEIDDGISNFPCRAQICRRRFVLHTFIKNWAIFPHLRKKEKKCNMADSIFFFVLFYFIFYFRLSRALELFLDGCWNGMEMEWTADLLKFFCMEFWVGFNKNFNELLVEIYLIHRYSWC